MSDPPRSELKPPLVRECDELRIFTTAAHHQRKRIGLVPTMGALHEGHLSLVDACRAACDFTVVSIFVNPTQFSDQEDFRSYPRSLEDDLKALGERSADLVFAPQTEQMYPSNHETFVQVGCCADRLEGAFRSGHFRGVATIVLKLFQLVQPQMAFLGQKDYQQLLVIRQMVKDLDLPVQICGCPIVRDQDGLALSSRNQHLKPDERQKALALPQSLNLAAELVRSGERRAPVVEDRVREYLRKNTGVSPQYVALIREGTMTSVEKIEHPTILAIAVKIGRTRLIDNCTLKT